jgi:uncharacterized protein
MITKSPPQPNIRIDGLIIKVAQRCNLACSYCYMYQHADQSYLSKPPVMTDAVFMRTIERLKDYLDKIPHHQASITFHGGEPTLIGSKRFRRYVQAIQDILGTRVPAINLQTNGTLLDDTWVLALRELGIEVGVSLDGDAERHDRVRFDHFGRGSHSSTVIGIDRLLQAGISPSIIAVVDPLANGAETYQYLRSLGIKRMDFLLPDVTHDTKQRWFPQYRAGDCAAYLISAFDAWLREDDPDVNVRMFRETVKLVLGVSSSTEALGNPTVNYLIIDTDGNIQGNDSLRVCESKMCETSLNVFEHGFDELVHGAPLLYSVMTERMVLCETCQRCPEVDVCGGGHMPHRYSRSTGFLNPSAWCEDLLYLVQHVRRSVESLGSEHNKPT